MATRPTMTREECEVVLGPRAVTFRATVENRLTVRKWLNARGMKSAYVSALALAELTRSYVNETTFEAHMISSESSAAPDNTVSSPDIVEPDTDLNQKAFDAAGGVKAATVTAAPSAASPLIKRGENDMAKVIASAVGAALASMPPQIDVDAIEAMIKSQVAALSMTETAIRKYIADELPKQIPVYRLEIKTPDGAVKNRGDKARHKQLPELLVSSSVEPVMLIGPAGSGKTTAAEQCAEALETEFYIMGATTGAHEVTGYVDGAGKYHTTPFRHAFEHGGFLCLDEIDAGDPGALLSLNAALANCYMSFPDSPKPVARHKDFRVVACANTFGHGADRQYVGRNQLDGATLDRFVRIHWNYDEKLEKAIAGNDDWTARVQALRAGATKEKARIIISPRASIKGARLMAAGFTRAQCEETLIWPGVDAELRSRIERSAA